MFEQPGGGSSHLAPCFPSLPASIVYGHPEVCPWVCGDSSKPNESVEGFMAAAQLNDLEPVAAYEVYEVALCKVKLQP